MSCFRSPEASDSPGAIHSAVPAGGAGGSQPAPPKPTARRACPRASFGHCGRKTAGPTKAPFAPGRAEPSVAGGPAASTFLSSDAGPVEPVLSRGSARDVEASSSRAPADTHRRAPRQRRIGVADTAGRSTARAPSAPAELPVAGERARKAVGAAQGSSTASLPAASVGIAAARAPAESRARTMQSRCGGFAAEKRSAPFGTECPRTSAGGIGLERGPTPRAALAPPQTIIAERARTRAASLFRPLGLRFRSNSDREPPRTSAAWPLPIAHAPRAAGTGYRPAPLRRPGSALGPMVDDAWRAPSAASEAAFTTRDRHPAEADTTGGDRAVPPRAPAPGPSAGERGRVIGNPTAGCGDRRPSRVVPDRSLDSVAATAKPLRGSLGTRANSEIGPVATIRGRYGSPRGRGRAGRLWPGARKSVDATPFVVDPSRPAALGSLLSLIRPARALPARRGRCAAVSCTARARPPSRSITDRMSPVRVAAALTPLFRARNRASRPGSGSRAVPAAPVPAAATVGARPRGRP